MTSTFGSSWSLALSLVSSTTLRCSMSTPSSHGCRLAPRPARAPDASSLDDLKTLIASKLSPKVPLDSIRLSLNRTDELLSPSSGDSHPSLGLTSGDLLFFSLAPDPQTLSLTPTPILAPENPDSNAPSQKDDIFETTSPCRFMIHGINGSVAPLSPLSCSHGDPHPAFTPEHHHRQIRRSPYARRHLPNTCHPLQPLPPRSLHLLPMDITTIGNCSRTPGSTFFPAPSATPFGSNQTSIVHLAPQISPHPMITATASSTSLPTPPLATTSLSAQPSAAIPSPLPLSPHETQDNP